MFCNGEFSRRLQQGGTTRELLRSLQIAQENCSR